MPKDKTPGRPTTRRYADEEKAQAVRAWVRQADVDGGLDPGGDPQAAAHHARRAHRRGSDPDSDEPRDVAVDLETGRHRGGA